MYDKTIRRRRAVLGVLVVLSLLLLIVYFGESFNGRLHAVQRSFLAVVSPVQDGASKAVKPVRDLFGWFGDTLHAKGQRDKLQKEIDALRPELIAAQAERRTYRQLLPLYHLERLALSDYHPVPATVFAESPSIWYQTVTIDKGIPDGVRVNDPVVNDEGLVGRVVAVATDAAQVDLITDTSMGVMARIGTSNATGEIVPKVGEPNDLLVRFLPANQAPVKGESVVTSGTIDPSDPSLYPAGIPLGTVSSVNEESAYTSVNVRPAVDLHTLDVVDVLNSSANGRAAQLASAFASLSAQTSRTHNEQLASTGNGE
ncbi:MAG: rod shape-determining protein MreC [Solirubrobacteraceae bacterium]